MAAEAGSSSAQQQAGPQQRQQQTITIIKSPLDRKQDIFDAADFEPTKFINQIYPDGAAVQCLDHSVHVRADSLLTCPQLLHTSLSCRGIVGGPGQVYSDAQEAGQLTTATRSSNALTVVAAMSMHKTVCY